MTILVRATMAPSISLMIGLSDSAVSYQLRQMRIVVYRKEGRIAYYRLDDEHTERLFRTGLEHVRE